LRAGLGLASWTTTRRPARAIVSAAINPAGPAPMTIALVSTFILALSENPRGVIAWRSSEKPELAMADAADFRRIALSFEGAGEYPHFDRRAFKARVPSRISRRTNSPPTSNSRRTSRRSNALSLPTHSPPSTTPGGGAAGPARGSRRAELS
jgi:hypothetical protein